MLQSKCFAYGRSVEENDVLIIGKGVSQKDFYNELRNYSQAMRDPSAIIFNVDEPTFNRLKSIEGVRII
jgi:hypothetical protein